MIPEHYSLAKEHDDHFEIHDHRDDRRFKISKKAIHPATQIKIMKMKKYADGGIAGIDYDEPDKMEDTSGTPVGVSAQDAIAAQANQFNVNGLQPGSSTLPPEALTTHQPQAQAPQPQVTMPNPLEALKQSQGLAQRGANEQYQAQAQQSQQLSDLYGQQQQQLQALSDEHGKRSAETQQRLTNLFDDATAGRIDPNNYWKNQSAHSKTMATLGVLLSGLGAGMSHSNVNMAMDAINKNIDRDIESQKNNLTQKNNLFHMYMQKYGSEEEAYARTKADMLTITAARANQIAAQAGTPQAAAARDFLKSQLGMQAAQYAMQFAGLGVSREAISNGIPVEAMHLLPEKQREQMVALPDGRMADAGSTQNAKEYNEATAAYGPLMSDLNELKQLNTIGGVVDPAQRARAEALKGHIVTELNDMAKSHRISESDIGFQKGQLSSPSSITNKLSLDWNAATDQLMESLNRKQEAVGKQYVPALNKAMAHKRDVQSRIKFKAR